LYGTPIYSEPPENGPDTHITLYSCPVCAFFYICKAVI